MTNGRSFSVSYADGRSVKVLQAPLLKLDEIISIQSELVAQLYFHDGMMGSLLRASNRKVWDLIQRMASLLPVEGGGFLESDQIGSTEDLLRVFFTTTDEFNELTGAVESPDQPYLPSDIAKLHGLNFYGPEGVLFHAQKVAQKALREAIDLAKAQPLVTEPVTELEPEAERPEETASRRRRSTAKNTELPVPA
jgi:hypothetical protein